ncbi:MAG: hypothetical protein HC919_12770 [Oscillatoriales cyanobacterium SM2_2_1]|nr:hypothetical protein [Oscillatoriales cyanobacterium SM2_2_1]
MSVTKPVHALDLLNNLNGADISGTTIETGGRQKAAGFQILPDNAFVLESITLRLEDYNTDAGDRALLQIYADSSRSSISPNGAVLQSLAFNNPMSISDDIGLFTFTPTTSFTFTQNTRYWLLVDAAAGVYEWRGSGFNPTPASGVAFRDYQISFDNGARYDRSNTTNAFLVTGRRVAVPFEFNSGLGLGALIATGVVVRRRAKKS